MIDRELQERLSRLYPKFRTRQWTAGFAGAIITAVAILGSVTFWSDAESKAVTQQELAEFTALVADQTERSPLGLWSEIQDNAAKPIEDFSPADRTEAAGYLLRVIKKEPAPEFLTPEDF